MLTNSKKIESNLARWRKEGWVTADGEAAIRKELAAGARTLGLANTLAILSAVLIGFAVMTFVGANWQVMPRLLRLAILFGAMWGAYSLASAMEKRGMVGFAHAAVLLAVSIFGANIMLISQMYHMSGSPADAILLWAAGALFAGATLQSPPSLVLAMILVALWGMMEAGRIWAVFWPFLGPWALVSAAFYWLRWRPGIHVSGLALTGFVVSLGYLMKGEPHWLVVVIGLMLAGGHVVGANLRPDLPNMWKGVLNYGLAIAFCGLFAMQFFVEPSLSLFVALALGAIAVCLAAIIWGIRTANPGATWIGYLGFSFEILSIYYKTIGTLLDTALFFLVTGLIVSILAALAYRIHSKGEAQTTLSAEAV